MGGSRHLWGASAQLTSVASKTRLVGISKVGGFAPGRHGGLGSFGIVGIVGVLSWGVGCFDGAEESIIGLVLVLFVFLAGSLAQRWGVLSHWPEMRKSRARYFTPARIQ